MKAMAVMILVNDKNVFLYSLVRFLYRYIYDMKQYIFTQVLMRALSRGRQFSWQYHQEEITPEVFLCSVLYDKGSLANTIFEEMGVSYQDLMEVLDLTLFDSLGDDAPSGSHFPHGEVLKLMKQPKTTRLLVFSIALSSFNKEKVVNSMHLVTSYLKLERGEDNRLVQLLMEKNITLNDIWEHYRNKIDQEGFDHPEYPKHLIDSFPQDGLGEDDDMLFDDDEMEEKISKGNGSTQVQTSTSKPSSLTPTIDLYGVDLTEQARKGELDPMIGREKELERVIHILSRRKKNNPVLIGEPGVGKSAIVEGLAQRIVSRDVNRTLMNKRIVSLDLALMVAGTKYRGQFEERIKAAIKELKEHPEIILFIDEIHTIIGAGATQGSMDTANILKPALARGELQCIGATTVDEYRKSIEKDGALERRFQKVTVEPTTREETETLLLQLKSKYEDFHQVSYTDEAIRAAVALTDRYVSDRYFPDKAIDAVDEAGASVHIRRTPDSPRIAEWEEKLALAQKNKIEAVSNQNYELAASFHDEEQRISDKIAEILQQWEQESLQHREVVDVEDVARVVALMTGVPTERVAMVENEKLRTMAHALKRKVIGQDVAIDKLVKSIQRNRVGLRNEKRPIGSFLFLGSTGIGKTYLAQKLAEELFGNEQAMIRIDMSEYMEKFSVSRLLGAPPGYVGYDEGGQLTEQVRRHPYSVVLLDEIEKAHPDVYNVLLQVLDEGHLTDSYGRRVDFKNTIIIITSNIGTRQLKEYGRGLGYRSENVLSQEEGEAILRKQLNKTFSPEFLNRLDNILYFESLDQDSILKIVDLELRSIEKRMKQRDMTLNVSEEAKKYIADKGYDPQYGARPIRRILQEEIEDPVTDLILEGRLNEGDLIRVDCQDGKIVIDTDKN